MTKKRMCDEASAFLLCTIIPKNKKMEKFKMVRYFRGYFTDI